MNQYHSALKSGATAVITGGASGIGLATAERLLEFGMQVWILDSAIGNLSPALNEAIDSGQAKVRQVDVSDFSAIETVAKEISSPVTFLMNNAAISDGGDALTSPEVWLKSLQVNLMGVVNGVQAFVPKMMASEEVGVIVNTGSKQGITQPPGNTIYNVTKSGVKALTEGLAHTLREQTHDRVTAHLLIPGFTYTGMVKQYLSEKPAAAWTPEQVAEYLLEGLKAGSFYILCPDNETTIEHDRKRIAWAAGDIIENRPALSRWHPDYKDEYEAFFAQE